MANKRPMYFDQVRESDFFENTPKHVLYVVARDLAAQLGGRDDLNDTTALVLTLTDLEQRVQLLKANQIIA